MTLAINTIHNLDAMTGLRQMDDESVHCIITSPPYFGLRDYGIVGQIGREETPQEYICKLVEVFRECRRVLRNDGTFWLNLGDSYAGSGKGRIFDGSHALSSGKQLTNQGTIIGRIEKSYVGGTMKPKDLMMMPHRVAMALQDDGWWVRSDIVWHKPNPMPESVTDRPTKAHEYIFLLSKSPRYFYDAAAIKEPAQDWGIRNRTNGKYHKAGSGLQPHTRLTGAVKMPGGNFSKRYADQQPEHGGISERRPYLTRNKRSVWSVSPKPFKGAHFATFPPELIEPCVLAGCPLGGIVLDPFMGVGTTAYVARQYGRQYIGLEINPDYCIMADERLDTTYTPDMFELRGEKVR